MADETQLKIIQENPIGKGLDAFYTSFESSCRTAGIACSPCALEHLSQKGLKKLASDLLSVLQMLPAASLLRSSRHDKNLLADIYRLGSTINLDDNFDLDPVKPLVRSALADKPDDVLIWKQVYRAAAETTPPPRSLSSSLQQTPWLHNTSSFANSSEYRQDVDQVLKQELGSLYVGLRHFHQTFFGGVEGLEAASKAVFERCTQGDQPLFDQGWSGWPNDANQDGVLSWFAGVNEKLLAFAQEYKPSPHPRRPLARPNQPIQGSTGERKLDVGFVNEPNAARDSQCHWSQILVPGELKSNPSADILSKAWLDLGKYAREVLAAQDTRRFVLGFTICGSLMRIWEFDRLGGIASEKFNINKDGLQFVSTILGFLWMSDEQLGFDPTITTKDGQRLVTINRNGQTERLVIDKLIRRARCIAGRSTTCWKAHREGDPQTPLVIKDSWQFTERDEEGDLLKEAAAKGVVNVARYYHHETVLVHGEVDSVQSNVRGGLNVVEAANYRRARPLPLPSTDATEPPRQGRSSGTKRSSSQSGALLPPNKRLCSTSSARAGSANVLPDRIHRRVIVRDYGTPIYEARSRSALLAALEGCIEGHESLHKAGLLHRDISINNLMINEDGDNSASWRSFLIDLDLAIEEQRVAASGAKGKTGTRAFMAIGALKDEPHSFMHDLESFFWVLFWICIHCGGPNGTSTRTVPEFDQWNYINAGLLAMAKKSQIDHEKDFLDIAEKNFTPHYQPLIPWVNRLRMVVFPGGRRWEEEDGGLYARMRDVLREARDSEERS